MKTQKKNINSISKLEVTIESYLKEVTDNLLNGRYDVATGIGLSALEMAQTINDKTRMCRAYCALSRAAVEQKRYDLCFEYCTAAKSLATELENPALIGTVYHQFGIMYYALQQFPKSMEYQQLSYTVHQENNDFPGMTAAMLMIADINAWMRNIPKALEIAINSLSLQIENEYYYQIVPTHLIIGTLYTNINKYDDALSHFTKALQIAGDNPRQMQNIYCNIADLYNHMEEYQKAVYYCNVAIDIIRQNELPKGVNTYPKFLSAIAYIQLGEYDNALSIAEYLLEEASMNNSLDTYSKAYECFMKMYKAKAMYQNALSASKQYYLFQKKRFNTQSTNAVSRLTTVYEVNSLQYTIEREQIRSEVVSKQINRTNKELTTLALTIAQKNEMLLTLFVQLQETMNMIKGSESRNALQQIMNELLSELDTEKSWSEFSEKFTSLHKTFLATLQQKYPNLSQTEQRMCALLKINLSTKDIANILGFEENTIEVYRKRIRKKMGLDKSVNLVTHIASL